MKYHRLLHGILFAMLATACSSPDDGDPVGPVGPPVAGPVPDEAPGSQDDVERGRHHRPTKRVAQALRDPEFRQAVFAEIAASGFAEKKVHLQAFLGRGAGAERRRLARLSNDDDAAVQADLDQGTSVEMYFPVAAHRQGWTGGTNLLVATAERDGETPVAYDLMGRRSVLSPKTPPATPVLMIAKAESRFDRGPSLIGECLLDCGTPPGSGGPPPAAPTSGIYMTAAKFSETFESWFKGNPEFEVHVLGQAGTSDAMTTYQCAGEHAGGGYQFDQNTTSWSGSVMLFSKTQLDQFKIQHPGQNIRLFVVEDDDTACEIRIDSTRTTKLFDAIKLVYNDLSGVKDTTSSTGTRILKRGPVYLRLIRAITSWFKTNDDPVGNAVEDPAAAGAFLPGATWLLKGENSVTNGALKLEYR